MGRRKKSVGQIPQHGRRLVGFGPALVNIPPSAPPESELLAMLRTTDAGTSPPLLTGRRVHKVQGGQRELDESERNVVNMSQHDACEGSSTTNSW